MNHLNCLRTRRKEGVLLLLVTLGALLPSVIPITGFGADSAPPAQQPPGSLLDLTLDQLAEIPIPKVEAASKWAQPVTQAPSSVTIVTAEQIKLYGYRTLADALQSVRSLYVSYDRNYSFLGTRGFNPGDYNGRILLLIDGHRVNNPVTDGAFLGTEFPLDVDLIERVEIVRGPGAVLYGNNAFFGVINVITRRGKDQPGYGAEVSGEAASFDTYKGRVTYAHRFTNTVELLLSGTLYDSDGAHGLAFRSLYQPPPGVTWGRTNWFVADRGDDTDLKSFFGKVAWRDFMLSGAFFTREKGNPAAPNLTVWNDPRTRTFDERSYVDLKFDHEFRLGGKALDVLEVSARAYYDRYEGQFDGLYDVPALVLNKDIRIGEWWGAEAQATATLWDKHHLALGFEYRDEFRQLNRNYDDVPGAPVFERSGDTRNYGAFLQGDFAVLTNLHLNAGFRYDQYGDLDPTANPRVALIYNPVPKSTLKAIYGSAFRAPNFLEDCLQNPQAPPLKPETIRSYELVWEQQFGRHLRSSVSGFYNQIDDLITVPPGAYATNLKGADGRGLELQLDGLWEKTGLRGQASYTFQETQDRLSHQWLTDSPKHLVKLSLSLPVVEKKVFASAEFQYTTRRRTLLGTDAAGFGIVNLTLFSQNLLKNLEVSASIYNLFDRRYSDPAPAVPYYVEDVIGQNGRTFRVKLTYRF
jgi:iron complex outermembrane receptor protein